MSADSVSVRVHRVQDGKETANVPARSVSSGATRRAPPSAPTKWKDLSKKERKAILAQRRGILNRFARTGVLSDSHPARQWVRLAKAAEAAASAGAFSGTKDMDQGGDRLIGTPNDKPPGAVQKRPTPPADPPSVIVSPTPPKRPCRE